MAGLSVGRELAKLRRRVLILEQEKKGGKTSRAAAGILDPYTEAEKETPLFQIGLKAFDFYPSFLEEITEASGIDAEHKKTGMLYLAFTAEDENFFREGFEWQKKRSLPVEFLLGVAARKLEPFVPSRTRSAVFYPEIPKVNANKLTSSLFEATRAAGAEIRTSVKNVSLWSEREAARGVRIQNESVEAPVVVCAEGYWAGLDKSLGIKINVIPVRGQILIMQASEKFNPTHILHTVRYAYIVPWPKKRLLVGSTLEPAVFENKVTPEGLEDILNRTSEIFEGIRELKIETTWAGLRPKGEDGMPLIGPTSIKGLFLASGYYRSGILISPLVGKLLAEGITSGKFSPLLEPFFPR